MGRLGATPPESQGNLRHSFGLINGRDVRIMRPESKTAGFGLITRLNHQGMLSQFVVSSQCAFKAIHKASIGDSSGLAHKSTVSTTHAAIHMAMDPTESQAVTHFGFHDCFPIQRAD